MIFRLRSIAYNISDRAHKCLYESTSQKTFAIYFCNKKHPFVASEKIYEYLIKYIEIVKP